MFKLLRSLAIAGVILFSIFLLCRITGIFNFYNVPSSSNEPTIKAGSYIITSNLRQPKNGAFVIYEKVGYSVGRIVAQEGEVIEIKMGNAFVDGKNVDKNITMAHIYLLDAAQYEQVKAYSISTSYPNIIPGEERYYVILADSIAARFNLSDKRKIDNATDKYIENTFGKEWNKDNFGPITVPPHKLFIMGDNRDNSEDSRYTGFVDEADVEGVIINR